jgi:hypothetical protein
MADDDSQGSGAEGDAKGADAPGAEPKADESEPPRQMFGLPMEMFVKGGTTTWAHDQEMARRAAEADARRAEDDQQRALASKPIEEGGGVLYNNMLRPSSSGVPSQGPKVLLQYMSPHGRDVAYECLADVVAGADPLNAEGLSLLLVCPRCMERGVKEAEAQLKISQSNKKWWLEPPRDAAHAIIKFDETLPDGSRAPRVLPSAGTVMECERFSCPCCSWTARIDKNRVYSG